MGNFNQADSDVAMEASAAATVLRLSRGIDAEHGAAVRKATTDYLTAAVAKDWPAMERGKASPAVTDALNAIYSAVLKFHSFSGNEGIVVADILRQVDRISEARRERLVTANGIVPAYHLDGAFRRRHRDRRFHVFLRHGRISAPSR